ncbi:magnesium transporter [Nitriliruptor alkaliphilus]|uniref:magnesium transporter n=1 Tax=Nitriliruptor alkaliphilus TaxID=427918 RepID=UPI0006983DE4|nr:magnesium transporter [Nitriliruptor alkaliphilus]
MADRHRNLVRVPGPILALGRGLGLSVGEVRSYWAQESRSIRSGSSALALGLGATLIAGITLASAEGRLESIPGLLALIPAAIGMRGAIFGALGSRLSTGIYTGQFDRQLTRRSYLGRQVEASSILSVASATQAGLIAWAISAALGLPTIPLLDLVAISLVGGLLSSAVLFVVVIWMARRSDRVGFSMDDVGAPIITATGDLVTLPALLVATYVLDVPVLPEALGALGLVGAVVVSILGIRQSEQTIRRVVRESLVVLTIAVTIDVFAGVVVEARAEDQFSAAALLVLIPPFIANCGSLGGMLSSRLASKLHLGQLEPRLLPGKLASLDFSLIALLAFLAFTGVGVAGWLAALIVPGVDPLSVLVTVGVVLLGGLFAFPILALAAYASAATSFRFGFDPDNHGIPIVTATMDLTGVLCLLGAITLLQPGA